jgi:hypothetical protein
MIENGDFTLQGEIFQKPQFAEKLDDLYCSNSEGAIFIIDAQDEAAYESYIHLLTTIHELVAKNRDILSIDLYGFAFDKLSSWGLSDTIFQLSPMHIWDLESFEMFLDK